MKAKFFALALSACAVATAVAQEGNVDESLDLNPAFEGMDTNNDEKITKEEWFAAGLSQMSYEALFVGGMINSDKNDFISRDELIVAIPRFDVDTDGDGKASVEEFVAAQNAAGERRVNEMGGEGGAPAGGPPGDMPPGPPPGQ